MKVVLSAIVLLAFVLILTSCHWDGSALTGTGQAKDPYDTTPHTPYVEVDQTPAPPCEMDLAAEGAVYLDPRTLTPVLSISSNDGQVLRVQIQSVLGVLPALATIRFQAYASDAMSSPVIRTLNCTDANAGSTSSHDYRCRVPGANNADDKDTFFVESIEWKIDGYVSNFVFRSHHRQSSQICSQTRGDRVYWSDSVEVPVLHVN